MTARRWWSTRHEICGRSGRTAGKAGLRIRFVADTHLHADFLSGAAQLRHDDGAQVLASAAAVRAFGHRGLVDGEQVDLGGLVLEAMATPGHTDEHLSFLLLDDGVPRGVFSGGSLIVGSAARTDLLGADRAEELARAQYASLQRLAALPDATALWPTHGAGSFCSAPPGADRVSTIGRERATNPLLGIEDEDRFVVELLGSLGSYPPYFLRLAEANRRGPAIVDAAGAATLRPLPVTEVRRLGCRRRRLVDVRPVADCGCRHVPGALSIPLRAQFATWLGWLVPAETPLVIVRNTDQDAEEIVWQALKIGYDRLAGELTGGIDAWTAAEQPTASTELITAELIGEPARARCPPAVGVRRRAPARRHPRRARLPLAEADAGLSRRPPWSCAATANVPPAPPACSNERDTATSPS